MSRLGSPMREKNVSSVEDAAFDGRGDGFRLVFLAHDAHGEIVEPLGIDAPDMPHPCGRQHRKPRAVGHAEARGELVAELVAGPVLLPADAEQVVVRNVSAERNLAPGIVILRVLNHLGAKREQRPQRRLDSARR